MSNILLICDKPSEHSTTYDLIAYWESFDESNGAYSLPKMVESNSEHLREKYLDWLYKIGRLKINSKSVIDHLAIRDDFSYWWMTLIIEKSQWKSSGLYKSFRLMALNLLLEQKKIEKIEIQINDQDACKSIKQWCLDNNIKYKILRTKTVSQFFLLKNIIEWLPNFFHAIIFLIRYLINRWPIKNTNQKLGSDVNKITFISYFFQLDKDSANKGVFHTSYWSSLHNYLSNKDKSSKVNWIHIFLKNNVTTSAKEAVNLVNKFNADSIASKPHMLLECVIGWKVIKGVIEDYFKLVYYGFQLRKMNQHFKISSRSINFWQVMKKDWNSSLFGTTAITNCLFLNLFENNLRQLPKQKKGFYMLENQAWERSLIYAWRKAGHGQLIGVQNSTVSFWDLRHCFSPLEYISSGEISLPIPDKIALNGNAAITAYASTGFPENKIVPAEALRYLYLEKITSNPSNNSESKAIRLLVVCDYSPKVTNSMLTLLSGAFERLPSNIKIIIKPHPMIPFDPLEWPTLDMQITYDSLAQLIDKYDVAFSSSSTSAAIEIYLSQKDVLIMLNAETFNMSPLRQIQGIKYIFTADDLVNKIHRDNYGEYSRDLDFFFTESNLPRWKDLIKDA